METTEARTYEEATKIVAKWWSEKLVAPLNQNNGDDSSAGVLAFMFMNMNAASKQSNITPAMLSSFESKLVDVLNKEDGRGRLARYLSVDYHPDQFLQEACEAAGIDPICLPIKSYTQIQMDNSITGWYQYSGKGFKL